MVEAHQRHPLAVLDWCLMPNHWHFAVMPERDDQVTRFFRWLTHAHAMRAITHQRVMGMGPLYQGRFRSLPVEADQHLLTLLRYVERNPLRAKLVTRSADWRWGSAGIRRAGPAELAALLSPWPVGVPPRWPSLVDRPQADQEVELVREHIRRSRPFGTAGWMEATAKRLGLESTPRGRGRPEKRKAAAG
jgi:putative transposase